MTMEKGVGSSPVERFTDNEEVDGPIPSRPTEMEGEAERAELGRRASSAWTVAKPKLYEGWRRRLDKK